SVVVEDSGVLLFGWSAYRRIESNAARSYLSLKVRVAFPEHFHAHATPLPANLNAEDLSVLMVAYLLQRGADVVDTYVTRLRATPILSVTLGVPMSQLDHADLRLRFLEVARCAFDILKARRANLREGITVEDAIEVVRAARGAIAQKPTPDPKNWVRSEAAAALVWAFRSPQIGRGRYGA